MAGEKSTFLFDKIIFGPVKSRRLGLSLGINLLSTSTKVCNFNCVYCECGANETALSAPSSFHPRQEVRTKLRTVLGELLAQKIYPDALTFAGNGEPTLHPQFHEIVNDTLFIRDEILPQARVAVLSNATTLDHTDVVEALRKCDLRILKLDAGDESTYELVNRPHTPRNLRWIVEHLKYFHGNVIIQSMFTRGKHEGRMIDNTREENLRTWLELIREISPKQVMIYSLDRHPAVEGLEKIPRNELEKIASRLTALNIPTLVS